MKTKRTAPIKGRLTMMKQRQNQKPSVYLILLSGLILCLGVVMLFLVNITEKSLHSDAKMINEAGIVRGSIQRITKLVLFDITPNYRAIFDDINYLLDSLIIKNTGDQGSQYQQALLEKSLSLKDRWAILKVDLIDYQTEPSESLKSDILSRSESCWDIAVAVVLMAQLATEEKVDGIQQLFYLILLLSLISGILLIFLLFLYVRNKLEYDSMHDSLTRLFNRRAYDHVVASEIVRNRRYHQGMALILFDVDYFKKINDGYGHQVGDQVLITLSTVVLSSVRRTDFLFRVGGEEFAIICPGISSEKAYKLAEKIRMTVMNHSLLKLKKVTISLGVSELGEGSSKEQLFDNADKALYQSKKAGRNRTEVYNNKPLITKG
jgi:diguanylate cyclase (GGDEF)-like protein